MLVVTLVLVVAAAAAGLAWYFETRPGDDTGDAAADSSATGSDSTESTAAPEATQTEPVLADVTWTYDSGIVFPFSESAGPAEWSEGEPATGFARNPGGALIAAYHISGRAGSSFPMETRLSTIDDQMTAGPNRDTFRAATEADAGQPEEEPEYPGIIAGYVLHSYTNAAANIEIAVGAQGTDFLASFLLQVEWDSSIQDWRLLPPGNGEDWQWEFRQLESLDGFTPWGP